MPRCFAPRFRRSLLVSVVRSSPFAYCTAIALANSLSNNGFRYTVDPAPSNSRGRTDIIQTEDEFENQVADELLQYLVGCSLEEQQDEAFVESSEGNIRNALQDQIERDKTIPNHVLRIVDIPAGLFELNYGNDCVNVNGVIKGT